ncbi:MAG: hypothetical protein LCH31_03560 [Actinobacteria bacterium]|nr:hypothetical protein [Actinomycetota bacterium]
MKTLLTERSQKGYPDEPLLAATQSHGVIRKSDYETRTVTATKDLHLLKLVKVGDFVISLRSFQGGIERCYHRGIISPAYTVLTAHDDSYRDYLTYLFKSSRFIDSLTLAVTGIREGQNIDYSRLAVDLLPVPPVEEQAAIVKYLAHANARIDNAIAAKRRLIALLEEQSLAVAREILSGRSTSHCGFDDGHRVPWIGKVPSKWGVAPLKRVARLRSGAGFPVNRQGHPGEELPFFRVSDMNLPQNLEWLATCESTVSRAEAADLGAVVFDRETIVFPKVGGALLTNKRRLLERPSCIDNNMMGATFFGLERDYAFEIMQLIDMADIVKPGPVPAVGQGDIGAIQVPIPPSSEQLHLVSVLKAEGAEVNDTIRAASAEITLLQEFRTRLVADVVTGQVDVRAVAETLPDPSMPDVSLDEDGIDLDDLYGHEDD